MSTAGFFDYDPPDSPASTPATAVEVLRFDGSSYESMPNIQVLDVQKREGLEPMTAHLFYVLDDVAQAFGWPTEFEQIMALSSASSAELSNAPDAARYIIQPDERLVIRTTDASGYSEILFDGFAQSPQVNFSKGRQQVSFLAVGVAVRLFSYPVMDFMLAYGGLEGGDVPSPTGFQGIVQAAIRFNPDGAPNCTPDEIRYQPDGDDAQPVPIFYEDARKDGSGYQPVPWTLAKAARYLLSYHLGDDPFVAFPDLDSLDRVLNRRMPVDQDPSEPIDPTLYYDPDDPSTYIESPITLRDFDISGMRWPDALGQMLEFSGFAAEFSTFDDGSGLPRTVINVYRKDAGGPYDPKTIGLQPRRQALETGLSAVETFGVVRDYKDAFNAVTMDAYPALFEVSIVLAMRGPVDPGDAVNPELWSSAGPYGTYARYRVWFADELGEGHVDKTGAVNTDAFDFSGVFASMYSEAPPAPVRRKRPSTRELISTDDTEVPKEATLYLSRDYAGDTAKPWDGTGTWQKIAHGWKLLDDWFGIELTADNLDAWTIGEYTEPDAQVKGKLVRVITSMAVNRAPNTRFFLRLDGTVEADARGFNDFPSRKASALKWDRYRYVSGKGSYQRKFVHESSPYYGGSPDSGRAAASVPGTKQAGYTWMSQVQAAGEDPAMAGPITIPWHTRAYQVGDRISAINGRDLSLQVNQGTDNGEAPAYPFVVGISWSFGDHESTTLDLSDHRSRVRE